MDYKEIRERLLEKGMSYTEYVNKTIEELTKNDALDLTEKEIIKFNFKRLNLQRSSRITRTYRAGEEIKKILNGISEPQLWLVITENWCGDSAQSLPYIATIAKENLLINLIILLRDSNPDVMDQYLTNGTRSIPKLVAFSEDGEELFRWGPRPKAVIEFINQWKEEGLEKDQWIEKLHFWYAKNKGTEIENEFIELIKEEVLTH